MKGMILGLMVVGFLAGPTAANAVTVVDTGVPFAEMDSSTSTNRAAQFAISNAVTIQSIESFFSVVAAGSLIISIYSDDQDFPGNSLFSTTISVNEGDFDWQGAGGLNWLIGPGTYWVATSNLGVAGAASYRTALGEVTNPMLKEATFRQQSLTLFAWEERFLDSGWRIQALADTEVPEPGTLALLTLGLLGLGMSRRKS